MHVRKSKQWLYWTTTLPYQTIFSNQSFRNAKTATNSVQISSLYWEKIRENFSCRSRHTYYNGWSTNRVGKILTGWSLKSCASHNGTMNSFKQSTNHCQFCYRVIKAVWLWLHMFRRIYRIGRESRKSW